MGIVSHRITGLAALRGRLAALPQTASDAAHRALQDVAEGIADDIRNRLGGGPGPSLPGAVPADPAGRLADAVMVVTADPGSDNAAGESPVSIKVGLPYAAWLEFGTRRMAARPFLRPAALRATAAARAALSAAVRRSLGKATGRTS